MIAGAHAYRAARQGLRRRRRKCVGAADSGLGVRSAAIAVFMATAAQQGAACHAVPRARPCRVPCCTASAAALECAMRVACCCSAALRRPPAVACAAESGASPRRLGLVRTIIAEWMRLLRLLQRSRRFCPTPSLCATRHGTRLPPIKQYPCEYSEYALYAEPAGDKARHPPRGAVLTLTVHRATAAGNGRHCGRAASRRGRSGPTACDYA